MESFSYSQAQIALLKPQPLGLSSDFMDSEPVPPVYVSGVKSPCSKGLPVCDSETLLARRKRLEIRRFKMGVPGFVSLEPPRKRCKSSQTDEEGFENGFTVPVGVISSDFQFQVSVDTVCDDEGCGKSFVVEKQKAGSNLKPCYKLVSDLCPSQESDVDKAAFCAIGSDKNLVLDSSSPTHGLVSIVGRSRMMKEVAVAFAHFAKLACDCGTSANGNVAAFYFYGVFDGYGGAKATIYCKETLHRIMAEELILAMQNKSNEQAFLEWSQVMASAFLRVDAELGRLLSGGQYSQDDGKQRRCLEVSAIEKKEGATVTLIVLCPNEIVVASCSSSKVVLGRAGKVIILSPNSEHETERAEVSGNRVTVSEKPKALHVRTHVKRYFIGDPEIINIARSQDDDFLILASEGLWDALPIGLVSEVTRKCLAGRRFGRHNYEDDSEETAADAAAALLTKLALARGSRGNISVIVVDLKVQRNLS